MQLLTIGVVLLVMAIAIAIIQLGAHRCPRHQKSAGILAWIIVALCSVCGVVLVTKGLSVV